MAKVRRLLGDEARRLVSEIPVVVYTCEVEPPYPTTFITENVKELYGYEVGDVLADGEFWVKQMPATDADEVRWQLAHLSNGPASLEYRFRCADGRYRWLRDTVKLVHDDEGDPEEIVGCIVDITDQKAFERELRDTQAELRRRIADLQATEARLRSVMDSAPAYILSVDRQGTIEFINRTLHYHVQEEVVGTTVYAWTPPQHRDKIREALEHVFRTGESVSYMTEAPSEREKESAWYDSKVAPVVVDGQVVGATVVASDVTERRRLADHLRRQQAELEHANRLSTIGAMTASIAHELNQPLAAIHRFSVACLRQLASDNGSETVRDRLSDHLEKISKQGERAGLIVQSLRQYARKGEHRPTEVDVNDVVRGILPILDVDCAHCQVEIALELDESRPRVYMDVVRLQQVLTNLICNAKEACLEASAAEPCVRVTTSIVNGGRVRIAVSDGGPGLAEEDLERVFEAFFTTKPAGMGLGLAISKSIVETSGGELRVRNRDHGAEFWFELPLVEAARDGAPS